MVWDLDRGQYNQDHQWWQCPCGALCGLQVAFRMPVQHTKEGQAAQTVYFFLDCREILNCAYNHVR